MRSRPASPPVLVAPGSPAWFPDPRRAGRDGLLAVGGDLSRERLLLAYQLGIFPWFDGDLPPLWWSPDPRAVLPAQDLRVSRRLARRLRQGRWRFTWNTASRM